MDETEPVPPRGACTDSQSSYRKDVVKGAVITASLGSFNFGFNMAVMNTVWPVVNHFFQWGDGQSADTHQALMNTMVFVGAAAGSLTAAYFLRWGRRRTMLFNCVGFIGGALICIFSPFEWLFDLGRFISGYSVGIVTVAVPSYITEVAPPEAKGHYGVYHQLMLTVGIVVGIAVGLPIRQETAEDGSADLREFDFLWWRVTYVFGAAVAFVQAVLLLMCYRFETPTFLIGSGRLDEARSVFVEIYGPSQATVAFNAALNASRGGGVEEKDEQKEKRTLTAGQIVAPADIEQGGEGGRGTDREEGGQKKGIDTSPTDLTLIESSQLVSSTPPGQSPPALIQSADDAEKTKETEEEEDDKTGAMGVRSLREALCNNTYFRAIAIGCMLSAFQQFSGVNVVISRSNAIFAKSGVTGFYASLASLGVTVLNLVTTLFASRLVETMGRKRLLFLGNLGQGVALVVPAVLFIAIASGSPVSQTAVSAVAVIGVAGFIVAFAISMGPVVWIYLSEMFVGEAKGQALSLACGVNWAATIGTVFASSFMSSVLTFTLFCGMSFLGAMFVWANILETRGLPVNVSPFFPETVERHRLHQQRQQREMEKGTGSGGTEEAEDGKRRREGGDRDPQGDSDIAATSEPGATVRGKERRRSDAETTVNG
uniref:Hexose transporter 1 n=1 Tax=Chromera velia CCMP2878 TaxID=1169474 RepID=A0A0G4I1A0_9ALVE|eukprot:Cvel_49.t1-p1 / transcript=Cvel_49.t1 / gene=Cvel_49 / organism=Chromera_velia_CCMP2878 / gene_product=Plastidic glucose transporter 4, putative / transcript_product=Plastidic glucose transporter 4, putative / location=Cvel_scaffold5:288649-291784(-) / protein_length=654 / sequence_SO=supercontig / SO=protein_coding / is_pseudo=false